MQQPDRHQLQNALAHFANAMPSGLKWVTLVTVDGLLVASYPEQSESDRIAAKTANLDAVCDRISSEFDNGGFRYAVVGGTDGFYLMLGIPGNYFIALNFAQLKSLWRNELKYV